MRVYYRKVRATGVWHILDADVEHPETCVALCGETARIHPRAGLRRVGGVMTRRTRASAAWRWLMVRLRWCCRWRVPDA